MQYNPSTISYDNQGNNHANEYPLVNQPLYQVGNVHPPSLHTLDSQPSTNDTDHTVSSAQHYSELVPCSEESSVTVSIPSPLKPIRILATISSKLRVFFIISGIIYLLWGMLTISLETALIMYSYSTFYRGLFSGCMMLATGINMLIIASEVYYSMFYVLRLLVLTFVFCIAAVGSTGLDLGSTPPCHHIPPVDVCDTNISRQLKLVILVESSVTTIYTVVLLVIARRIQKKSASKLLAESTESINIEYI